MRKGVERMKIILIADEGKMLTDGENYGSTIDLGIGRNVNEFDEISKEEYENIIAKKEAEIQ